MGNLSHHSWQIGRALVMPLSGPEMKSLFFSPALFASLSESPTVMLSAGSFSSPYEHLSQPETKRMVEHYTAYLSDNTRLIANPGLKVSAGMGPHFWCAPPQAWERVLVVNLGNGNPSSGSVPLSWRAREAEYVAQRGLVGDDPSVGLRSPMC